MRVLPKCGTRSYVLYYVLISIAYLQINQFLSSAAGGKSVCTTAECKELDHYYKKIMNMNGSPCDDFYDFVCREWGTHYPRPHLKRLWAVHNQLELTTMSNIRKLLEEKRKDDTKDEVNAKLLYAACMKLNTPRRSTSNATNIMNLVGNWPMFPQPKANGLQHTWQHIHAEYLRLTGDSALFAHFLGAEITKTSFVIRPVIQGIYSPYGILKRDADWNDNSEKKHYKDFLTKLIHAVEPYKPKKTKEIEKDVEDVIKFREKLRHTISINQWNNYETMTIANYQHRYDSVTINRDTAKIDWLTVVRAIYQNTKDAQGRLIDGTSLIKVQPEYLTSLSTILAETKDRVIANHIHLFVAERHVDLTPDMDTDLEKSVLDILHGTGSITVIPERWTQCVANKEIQTILGRMYLKSHFTYSNELEVTNIILRAGSVLQDQISESTWVDKSLQTAWTKHYQDLKTQIGYPKWYFDQFGEATATVEDINPIELDVHYSTTNNRMGVSAAYLQFPIYDANIPLPVQYGAFLPAVGHELYHAFNYTDFHQNLLSVKDPEVQKKMLQEFQKRAQCFTNVSKKYKLRKIKKPLFGKDPVFPSTLNEDIPDGMGLKMAYRGYKEKFWSLSGNCASLPGFPYNCDQLFFIAYASSLCVDANPNYEKNVLLTGDQNPTSVRVNAAVANMKEFEDAFNCKQSDHLVLKNRCDLWKN